VVAAAMTAFYLIERGAECDGMTARDEAEGGAASVGERWLWSGSG